MVGNQAKSLCKEGVSNGLLGKGGDFEGKLKVAFARDEVS